MPQRFTATLCGGPRHGEQFALTSDCQSLVCPEPIDAWPLNETDVSIRLRARHTYERVRRVNVGSHAHILLAHETIGTNYFYWSFGAAEPTSDEVTTMAEWSEWWEEADRRRRASMSKFPVLPDSWEWVWQERPDLAPPGDRIWRCRPWPKNYFWPRQYGAGPFAT